LLSFGAFLQLWDVTQERAQLMWSVQDSNFDCIHAMDLIDTPSKNAKDSFQDSRPHLVFAASNQKQAHVTYIYSLKTLKTIFNLPTNEPKSIDIKTSGDFLFLVSCSLFKLLIAASRICKNMYLPFIHL
jgi:hypothetical protein